MQRLNRQGQHREQHAGTEQNTHTVRAESQEPAERQLDSLIWMKLSLEEQAESWHQWVTKGDSDILPTHLRPFSSPAEYELVKSTHHQLLHSGYYWGPMTMEEAHRILSHSEIGTFLIRDSCQPDVLFTLSYQSVDGATSVRVHLDNQLFRLHGSHRNFPSLFTLLSYYTSSSCKLTVPYRQQRPESLKQLCRRAIIRTYGPEKIDILPGLSKEMTRFVHTYPYCI
uniref:Suppressor of cytokine signaling 1b n=1 Tax=Cynoglossus semilaevis TaxID=244447 RepID=A0A3P8UV85_CYNSE